MRNLGIGWRRICFGEANSVYKGDVFCEQNDKGTHGSEATTTENRIGGE
jgi:hypothetical protein